METVKGQWQALDRYRLFSHGLESVLDPPNRHAFEKFLLLARGILYRLSIGRAILVFRATVGCTTEKGLGGLLVQFFRSLPPEPRAAYRYEKAILDQDPDYDDAYIDGGYLRALAGNQIPGDEKTSMPTNPPRTHSGNLWNATTAITAMARRPSTSALYFMAPSSRRTRK
jgi:hypothetical protein